MGHEIVYCARCQTRIHGTEFAKGKAFAFSNRFCCAACAPELLKTLPQADKAALLAALQGSSKEAREGLSSSSTAMRALRPPTARVVLHEDSTRRRAVSRGKAPGIALGVGAGVAIGLAVVVALALSGRSPGPTPAAAAAPAGPAPAGPAAKPEADAALREAREFDRRQPGDLDGRIQRWEKAVWACEGGPSLADAKGGLAAALNARKEAVARDLAPLEAEIQALLEKESFRAALDVLDAARKRRAHPDWTLAVDKKISELRKRIVARFDSIQAEAADAKGRGEDARVREAVERVDRWGLADYAGRMKNLVAAPPGPAPAAAPAPTAAPAAEVSPYPALWEKAMALAALRDYAGAVKELSAASPHPEAAGDVEAIRKAGAVPAETREAIGRWTRGQKQSIGAFDATGRITRIDAPFLKVEDSRLMFGTAEETRDVEIGELAPSTLAALYLARPKKADGDERAALVFCLIEGDLEGAVPLQSPKAAVGAKYWDWARKAAAGRGGGREAEARGLFASAVDDLDDPSRAVASAVALKDLLSRYGDTPFVARNRGAIGARTSAGRDYLYFADLMSGMGAFRFAKAPKADTAWTCERDGDPAAPSALEFTYTALPDTEYRGWVYAGACCLETFDFSVQATGLRASDPKAPKDGVAAEPGGNAAAAVKIPFFMRKTHASHGGPKTATRWEWVSIPLPKSGEGGPKTVRLLSAQQGFSVAFAALSAAPDYTPKIAEARERERARAARFRSPGPPPEAGLVGYWSFDEGQGATAADASARGHHGTVAGAAWTQGKFGGGLRFDGDNSCVELPSTPVLDGVHTGDYTLSAWYKPEVAPAGKEHENDCYHAILIKPGWHIGLFYSPAQQLVACHYLTGDVILCAGAPAKANPTGTFYHAAMVFTRKTGLLRLFVNGQFVSSTACAPNTAARDFGQERWRIGCSRAGAATDRWTAKGVVDEVRIYDRALLASEIRALAGPRRAPAPSSAPAPAADARPWTALPLEMFTGPGYRMENGVLVRVPGTDNAARSPKDYTDVEFRIRFEPSLCGYAFFTVRQSGEGGYVASWNRGQLEKMDKKEHELIFVCKGEAVTATLDGQPQELERYGAPKSGALQFNSNSAVDFKVKSIEVRDPR
jgi:hypothetical protein